MGKYIIEGESTLNGEIFVSGNKNAALPIIAATALSDEPCVLDNVPEIRDVQVMFDLLIKLGKNVEKLKDNKYQISGVLTEYKLDDRLAGNLRASILYLGVLLARSGEIEMTPPGGCVLGRRNVDSHFDAISDLGAEVKIKDKKYVARLTRPHPADIFLKEASVTATENAMFLASGIKGETIIRNAASEPHIVDLAIVLKKMGVEVSGDGTNTIKIKGIKKFQGFEHRVMPDHIEAGTFSIAAACTGSELIIHDAYKKHLHMTEYFLKKLNVNMEFIDHKTLRIKPSRLISDVKKIQVTTWPGFPTDLMSPIIVLATQAEGVTLCHDWMYESRMFFVDKLIAMGAQITQCDPHRVLVVGPTELRGQILSSPDIRAGIALMIAAMSAKGVSEIDKAELIDRGYENIATRLNMIGANIRRVD
jgi:UDP-N-acetylglucosamine 1-carboxyvinyltransferase